MLNVAKEVVAEMLPKPGIKGLDLDTDEYEVVLGRHSDLAAVDVADLDLAVRALLNDIGRFGFSCLD